MSNCTQTIDPVFFNTVSQLSHFGWGFFIVLFIPCILRSKWLTFWVALVFEIYAIAKEFWWDEDFEDTATRGSSLEDWGIQTVGVVVAIVTVWWSLPGSINPFDPFESCCYVPKDDTDRLRCCPKRPDSLPTKPKPTNRKEYEPVVL